MVKKVNPHIRQQQAPNWLVTQVLILGFKHTVLWKNKLGKWQVTYHDFMEFLKEYLLHRSPVCHHKLTQSWLLHVLLVPHHKIQAERESVRKKGRMIEFNTQLLYKEHNSSTRRTEEIAKWRYVRSSEKTELEEPQNHSNRKHLLSLAFFFWNIF